jgi:hypothetical protein
MVLRLQEISELDRQLNDLNSHLADLAGLRELESSMAATKAAEEAAQAQHDSQAEQVGGCFYFATGVLRFCNWVRRRQRRRHRRSTTARQSRCGLAVVQRI